MFYELLSVTQIRTCLQKTIPHMGFSNRFGRRARAAKHWPCPRCKQVWAQQEDTRVSWTLDHNKVQDVAADGLR